MNAAQRLARLRLVRNKLELRGGRELELVELLDDVLVDLTNEARGGTYVLRSDEGLALEQQLEQLVDALRPEHRKELVELLLNRDGHEKVLDIIEERVRVKAILEGRRT